MNCSNTHECPCKNLKCPNRAKCCDCVANHASKGVLPACLRHIPNMPTK